MFGMKKEALATPIFNPVAATTPQHIDDLNINQPKSLSFEQRMADKFVEKLKPTNMKAQSLLMIIESWLRADNNPIELINILPLVMDRMPKFFDDEQSNFELKQLYHI